MPFRVEASDINNRVFNEESIKSMVSILEKKIPQVFLFTSNIRKMTMAKWEPCSETLDNLVVAQLRTDPRLKEELKSNLMKNEWKKTNKLANIFKAEWTPKIYNQTIEVSHSHRSSAKLCDADIIDTYLVSTILAPTKIRDVASQDIMKPLQLLPSIGLAAHVKRLSSGSVEDFIPCEGSLFCGFDSGLKTGLPFSINAPIFFHELKGSVILSHSDDLDIQTLFPWVRMAEIGESERKYRALFTWNRSCLFEAMTVLLPDFMLSIRDSLHLNPERFYMYWPRLAKIRDWFRNFLSSHTYESLSKLDIFLTKKNGFQKIDAGCFASPEFQIPPGAAKYFQSRYKMFSVPVCVVEDLKIFSINVRELSPPAARKLLRKKKDHCEKLRSKPDEALDLLEYCLSDAIKLEALDRFEDLKFMYFEVSHLCLVPVMDGTVVIPRNGNIIVANREQQSMFPALLNKFVHHKALKKLKSHLSKDIFFDQMNLQVFGPEVIAKNMHFSPWPRSWKGKDFVPWNEDSFSTLWLFQFWKEVSICENESLRLFDSWPLIPLKTGELTRCANARYILSFYPGGHNESLHKSLEEKHMALKKRIADEVKREKVAHATTSQIIRPHMENINMDDTDICFIDSDVEDDTVEVCNSGEDDSVDISTTAFTTSDDTNHNNNVQLEVPVTPPGNYVAPSSQPSQNYGFLSSLSNKNLHDIVVKLRGPVLELAYFAKDDILQIMPRDGLQLSRNILSSISQCLDYWTHIVLAGQGMPMLRLDWSTLTDDEFGFLLKSLTRNDQGNRLSLMTSDFDLLRGLVSLYKLMYLLILNKTCNCPPTMDFLIGSKPITFRCHHHNSNFPNSHYPSYTLLFFALLSPVAYLPNTIWDTCEPSR